MGVKDVPKEQWKGWGTEMIEAQAIWVFAALRYLKFELNLNKNACFGAADGTRTRDPRDTLTNATTVSLYWWVMAESNRQHPACKAGALPTELITP